MRILSALLAGLFLCSTVSVIAQPSAGMAMPQILVYKTRANYNKLVPVLLSPDKKRIISYPAPGDVTGGASGFEPVQLHKGYLLDKMGVAWNTAFLKYTYEEYAKLKTLPSEEEMYKMIVDKDPLVSLYDCGRREPINNLVHKFNDMIDEGKIKKKCQPIKKPKTTE